MSLFEECYTTLGDSNITGLIDCVSGKQDEARDDLAKGLNSFFFVYGGALVFFMQTGFAMLTAGSCRAKNVKHVILWNLLDSAGGGIAFWVTGYAFAYGSDDPDADWSFLGTKGFFLQNAPIDMKNFFFQWAFACAVSSIIAGTIAERTQMKAYLLYSMFFVGFVYPVVSNNCNLNLLLFFRSECSNSFLLSRFLYFFLKTCILFGLINDTSNYYN
jgi:ammonium transporter, Amt family